MKNYLLLEGILLTIVALSILGICYSKSEVSAEDVYCKLWLYDSKTDKLFTGKVIDKSKNENTYFEFKDGLPYGEFRAKHNNETYFMGKYLDDSILHAGTRKRLNNYTYRLKYWNEGAFRENKSKMHLTLEIYVPKQVVDSLQLVKFSSTEYDEYLVNNIFSDTKNLLEYNYIEILYKSCVYLSEANLKYRWVIHRDSLVKER